MDWHIIERDGKFYVTPKDSDTPEDGDPGFDTRADAENKLAELQANPTAGKSADDDAGDQAAQDDGALSEGELAAIDALAEKLRAGDIKIEDLDLPEDWMDYIAPDEAKAKTCAPKVKRCVEHVLEGGKHDESSAYAICFAAVGGGAVKSVSPNDMTKEEKIGFIKANWEKRLLALPGKPLDQMDDDELDSLIRHIGSEVDNDDPDDMPDDDEGDAEQKYNENHDPSNGQFASGSGGSAIRVPSRAEIWQAQASGEHNKPVFGTPEEQRGRPNAKPDRVKRGRAVNQFVNNGGYTTALTPEDCRDYTAFKTEKARKMYKGDSKRLRIDMAFGNYDVWDRKRKDWVMVQTDKASVDYIKNGGKFPDHILAEAKSFAPPAENEEKHYCKFIGNSATRIRDYAALWGSPQQPDLSAQRDYFTRETDFWDGKIGLPRPLTYHHGFEKKTSDTPVIGTIVALGEDDLGKWYEAELDKSHKYFEAVRKLIAQRALKSSSDSVPQYVRRVKQTNGTNWLKSWALFGVTLTPTPAEPRMPGAHLKSVEEFTAAYKSIGVNLQLPEAGVDETPAANGGATSATDEHALDTNHQEATEMDEQKIAQIVAEQIARRDEEAKVKAEAEAKAKADFDAAVETAAKAKVEEQMKQLAIANRRLPFAGKAEGGRITVYSKYDAMLPEDLAFLAMLRAEAKMIGRSQGPDEELLRALAVKSFAADEKRGEYEMKVMAEAAFKSNEVMQSTLASYGDEWVFSNVSTQLWLKVRGASRLLSVLPQQEIPKGWESETIPLEGTDFTFYNMAQAASEDGTSKEVLPTVTTSKIGTGQRIITIGKLGAKGTVAGELDEDSIIDAIPNARQQLERQLPEELDFVLFNADSTAATDNINGNGTPVSGADYTVFLGLIRLGLKTNTANAKDMGAAITSTKINQLYQLLGTDGQYVAEDPTKCFAFCDYSTWWKLLAMSDLLTVANAGEQYATIAKGALPDGGIPIFGVKWYPSVGVKKAQATGIRHGTEGSNTLGRGVLIRPDQWQLRWKRRMKFETQRVPDSDTTKVVASLRLGIGYYDTDAAAVAYNI